MSNQKLKETSQNVKMKKIIFFRDLKNVSDEFKKYVTFKRNFFNNVVIDFYSTLTHKEDDLDYIFLGMNKKKKNLYYYVEDNTSNLYRSDFGPEIFPRVPHLKEIKETSTEYELISNMLVRNINNTLFQKSPEVLFYHY